jgi:hypothetical protein
MNIDWNIFLTIAMPIISIFFGALITHLFTNRERLITHYGHVSSFKVKQEEADKDDYWVYTHSVVIRNIGRKTARNVRLGHAVLPQNVRVEPDIDYIQKDLPGGGKEFVFPSLVPKKQVTISYLYFPPLTYNQINTHVESDEGPAKLVTALLQPQAPKWLVKLIWALIVIGTVALIYLAFMFIKVIM